MSRPAFKPVRQRTTDCPTCAATKYHPCVRVWTGRETPEQIAANLDRGEHVSPHAARLRAEKALREAATQPR